MTYRRRSLINVIIIEFGIAQKIADAFDDEGLSARYFDHEEVLCCGSLLALVLWCLENTTFQTLAFRSAVSK